MSRETIVTFRDNDDKENGKVARVRSPMGSSKATKNFMSPTISAASKITPSPRKKVLEERNEPVRASVSFSDLKFQSFSEESIADSEHKKESLKIEPVLDSKEETLRSKNESESISKMLFEEPQCFNKVNEEPELVNLDPTFKISPPPPPLPPPTCSSSVPIIAPLDSDPLAPPYDPKTNYLSPRPQFLHYKPNPRVEIYLSKTKDGKRLEDSFISGGTLSDTDITTEEETQSDCSQKELEGVSSSEAVEEEKKEQVEVEEEELLVSEPSLVDALTSSVEIVEAKKASKPRSLWRSKLTSLLIILSFVCLAISATNSPVIDHSVFDSSTLLKQYDYSEIIAFAKAKFDGLAQNFGVWYADCVSFFFELMSSLRGAHKLGHLQYCNLTSLVEDVKDDDYEVILAKHEFNMFVASSGNEVYIELMEENGQLDIAAAESIFEAPAMHIDAEYEEQESLAAEAPPPVNDEGKSEEHISLDSQEVEQAPEVEMVEPESSAREQSQEEVGNLSGDFKDETVLISQVDEIQPEVSEAGIFQDESDTSSSAEIEPATEDFSSKSPEIVDASPEDAKGLEETVNGTIDYDNLSKVNVLGVASLVVLALIASTVFIFVKKGNNNSTSSAVNANSVVSQGFASKKLDSNPIQPVIPENTFEVMPSSWNYSGDSCPSEMSSFTSSYTKKGLSTGLNEAQSYERKSTKNNRRESMASSSMDSSMGSPSYGSFTTYEKIPTKHVSAQKSPLLTT